MPDLSKWGPLTVLVIAAVGALLIAGGVVTITHPETLSFQDYFNDGVILLGLLGLGTGVGRGVHLGLQQQQSAADRSSPQPAPATPAARFVGDRTTHAASPDIDRSGEQPTDPTAGVTA